MRTLPGTLPRRTYKQVKWQDEYGTSTMRVPAAIEDAEVISSEIGDGIHAPVLDIDYKAMLVPSTTSGHYHLYLDTAMSWRQYKKLLKTLAAVGVIEKGYAKACIKRKHSAVRAPWVKKNG